MHNQYIDYAAKMTIALTYLKSEDDWLDDQKMTKQLYKKILEHSYQKVKEEYPQKDKNNEEQLVLIHQYEQQESVHMMIFRDALEKSWQKYVLLKMIYGQSI